MRQALIGHTGFVGSTLARTEQFDAMYNSSTIATIAGERFDRVVCAGVSAVKWQANRYPEQDRQSIGRLIGALDRMQAARLVLISTVDVYPDPNGVTESDEPSDAHPQAYGRHRRELERWIAGRFPVHHVVRLPALFGSGLRKNALFDLMHCNMLSAIHPDSRFQWYPLSRLACDLRRIELVGLATANLATQPLTMRAVVERFFPDAVVGGEEQAPASYDVRTMHAGALGGVGSYLMDQQQVLSALGHFLAHG